MGFDPDEPLAQEVLQQFAFAANRGVAVTFGVDAFAMLEPRAIGPVVLPLPFGRTGVEKRYLALEALARNDNARYGIINMPRAPIPNPFAGRSHMKLAVVNDYAYLGGPSFQGCDRIDMVVGLKDRETADWIYDLTVGMTEAGSTEAVLGSEDQIRNIDEKTQVLIDAGKPRQSLILDETLQLIDDAEDWLIIGCQFLPTGETGRRLVRAIKRGIDVHIAHNHPSKYDRMNLAHRFIMARERRRNPPEFFANQVPVTEPALHTKAIANESTSIVGSHNFIDTGVKFGTPEIVLRRRDVEFAQAVRSLLLKEVGIIDRAEDI